MIGFSLEDKKIYGWNVPILNIPEKHIKEWRVGNHFAFNNKYYYLQL